mmetsp:Transcript_21129/g.36323  ORF Transcript_21129/g.36323 Transcript_21129/m.36323 type:complete len:541 (+) Transcript_21129:93-1715(+)
MDQDIDEVVAASAPPYSRSAGHSFRSTSSIPLLKAGRSYDINVKNISDDVDGNGDGDGVGEPSPLLLNLISHNVADAEAQHHHSTVLAVEGGGGVVEVHLKKDLTVTGAITNVVKLTLGAGSFAIPWCFLQSGILAGIIGVFLVAAVTYCCTSFLLQARDVLLDTGLYDDKELSFASIASISLGPKFSWLVKIATTCSCLLACSAYVAFIAGILSDFFGISYRVVACCILGPIFVLLSWIRTWKHVALWSTLGNLAFMLSFIAIFYDVFQRLFISGNASVLSSSSSSSSILEWVHWKTLPLFFGPVSFLFCFPYCIIPIENEMIDRRSFRTIVMPAALLGCSVLNIFIGIVCVLAYGKDTKDNVIRNVTPGPIVTCVSIGLAFDLLFTYALMFAPPREYIEDFLMALPKMSLLSHGEKDSMRNFIRAVLVGFTVFVAIVIPNFAQLTGFVGGLTDTLLAFVLPPFMIGCLLYQHLRSTNGESTSEGTNETITGEGFTSKGPSTATVHHHTWFQDAWSYFAIGSLGSIWMCMITYKNLTSR